MRSATILLLLTLLSAPALLPAGSAQANAQAAEEARPASSVAPNAGPAQPAATADPASEHAVQRVESHIADLRKRLAITDAQQPLWDAFAAIMRANAVAMEHGYSDYQAHISSMSASDSMRGYAAICRMHAENVQRLLPAFEQLYSSMNPEQRATADRTFHEFQRGLSKPGRV